jgi:pimeloyl-ACP methyl ester carboxylesterase
VWRCVVVLAALFAIGALRGWPIAWPFDFVMNLRPAVRVDSLRLAPDHGVHVVVLQHGIFRTAASLGRLARTLQAHGYEVLNPDYPSTCDRIEAHAERLAAAIARRAAAGPVAHWSFVGHSMGGLVIQQYLRSGAAVAPHACVYLGTPHRGALLAQLRRHWFLFRWVMGTTAASQLAPDAALHQLPIPAADRSGTLVGDLGPGNPSIPGADDGTVGVDEATFAGAAASARLPVGHTTITIDAAALQAVLQFLHDRTFPAKGRPQ